MVIIVEDEDMLLEMIASYLSDYDCIPVHSLRELKSVSDKIKDASCVFTDMNIGFNETGFDVMRYIKSINNDAFMVAMTGCTDMTDLTQMGFDACLYKPFSMSDLKALCSKHKGDV